MGPTTYSRDFKMLSVRNLATPDPHTGEKVGEIWCGIIGRLF